MAAKLRFFVNLYLAAALIPIAAAAESEPEPSTTAQKFLDFYFHAYKQGVPAEAERQQLAPLVTESLLNLLTAADQAEKCHYRQAGNSEPPLFEGDIFSSLFEGGTAAALSPPAVDGDSAQITVNWTYDMAGDAYPAQKWQDQLLLKLENRQWRINDLAHQGSWDFMAKGKLSDILADISKQCGN